jgi:hypothetical protein
MTTTIEQQSNTLRTMPDSSSPPRRRGGGRTIIGVVLIAALICSAVLQQVAFSYRNAAVNRNRPEGAPAPSRVANLDSFSLALLLGGLRGPLVMFLWTNSESQKSDKDLESFDTQVELIRLLQPEFDTVHLFQIWNKAYNVSVQLASLSNKYAAILDAVEYAHRTDISNPNDINIISATAGLFTDKLGNSTEKDYYRRRVRTETLPLYRVTFPAARVDAFKKAVADAGMDEGRVRLTTDPATGNATAIMEKLGGDRVLAKFKDTGGVTVTAVPRQSLRPESRSGRRTEMDTMLDANGRILPPLLKPTHTIPPGQEGNDGSELQYLGQFQSKQPGPKNECDAFPYGLSPLALGYNYAKRAQILQRVSHQKHLQLADQVIDNQPGLALKAWSDEEWDRGRRLEQRGLAPVAGAPVAGDAGTDTAMREMRTAAATPDTKVVDRFSIDEAIFSYLRATQAAEAALPELAKHIDLYPSKLQNYYSQSDNLKSNLHLTRADARYLQAIIAPTPEARKALLEQAKAEYTESSRWFMIIILKYYVDEPDAAALKYSLTTVQDKSIPELRDLLDKTLKHINTTYKTLNASPHGSDIQEYLENLARIDKRLALLK